MYETIKRLVEENKLSFAGNHYTNTKSLFSEDKNLFLSSVKEICEENEGRRKIPVTRDELCFHCGRRIRHYLEGETLVPYYLERVKLIPADECFYQEEVIVNIPVPSGELIFDDWFVHATELIGHLDKNTLEFEALKQRVQRVCDYASEGIAHFYIGNNSPSVFQHENRFLIGKVTHEENAEGQIIEIPLEKDANYTGYISSSGCITFCDRSIYKAFAIEKFGEEKGKEIMEEAMQNVDIVLQVEPGTYQLRYFTKVKENYQLYATLEKIN